MQCGRHHITTPKSDLSEAIHYKRRSAIRKFTAYHFNQISLCCEAWDDQAEIALHSSHACSVPVVQRISCRQCKASPSIRQMTQALPVSRTLLYLRPKIALLEIIMSHIFVCKSLPWHTKQQQTARMSTQTAMGMMREAGMASGRMPFICNVEPTRNFQENKGNNVLKLFRKAFATY